MEVSPTITSITNQNNLIFDANYKNDLHQNVEDVAGVSPMSSNANVEMSDITSPTENNNKDEWYEDLADALAGEKRCDLSVVRKITNCGVFPSRLRLSAWHACLGNAPDQNFVLSAQSENGQRAVVPDSVSTLIDESQARTNTEPYDLATRQLMSAILSSLSAGPVNETPLSSRELQPEFVPALDVIREVVMQAELGVDAPSKEICMRSLFVSVLDFIPSNINSAMQLLRLIIQYHDPELSLFLDSKKLFAPAAHKSRNNAVDSTSSSRSKLSEHKTVFERWLLSVLSSDVVSHVAIISIWDMYFQYHDPYLIFFVILVLLINIKDTLLSQGFESAESIETVIVNTLGSLEPSDVPDCMALAQFYSQLTPSSFRACCYCELFESVRTVGPNEAVPLAKEQLRTGKAQPQQQMPRNASGNNLEMKPYYYKSNMHIPVDQALCLPVTAEEMLESLYMPDEATASGSMSTTSNASNYSNGSNSATPTALAASTSALKFFIIDCRSSDDYNECHLSMAFHLEASLICTDPVNFATALETLLQHQSEVTAASASNAVVGDHICFLGYGSDPGTSSVTNAAAARDQHDQYMFMVQSRLLQRGKKMVSSLDGGFAEIMLYCSELDLVGREELLHGSDVHKYLAPPRSPSRSQPQQLSCAASSGGRRGSPSVWASNQPQQGWGKLFKTIVSHVKHQAEEYKEKLETYMDPYIEAAMRSPSTPGTDATPPYDSPDYDEDSDGKPDRWVDAVGRPMLLSLRSATSEKQEGSSSSPRRKQQRASNDYEYVNMNDFLRRIDNHLIAHFRAGEILHALSEVPPVPCTLVLTKTQLIIMRHLTAQQQEQFEGQHINGSIVARRSLDAVVKITAKKQCPEVVTIKYGTVDGDEFYITDMDRFFIPEAKDAVDRIKQAVLALCESLDKQEEDENDAQNDGEIGNVDVENVEMTESTMEVADDEPTSINKRETMPVHGSTSAPALNIGMTDDFAPSSSRIVLNERDSEQTLPSQSQSKKSFPLQSGSSPNESGSGDAGRAGTSSSPRLAAKKQKQQSMVSKQQEPDARQSTEMQQMHGNTMADAVGSNNNDDGLFSI